ncbi:MAG: B12-binding domain-containing radical SAM protein [Chloroflexi bacterium]|nr:B12-binding domain-containing radical SAM protein [Chloroflexota bacterium]
MKKKSARDVPVVFVITHIYGVDKFSYLMGIAYMAANLKDKGIPSMTISGTAGEIISLLSDMKKSVKIIGLPVYDFMFSDVKAIASAARRMMPGALIAAGGPTATFADDIILENIPEVDLAVRGEGEETIWELYQYAGGKISIDEIGGISYRDGGRIIRNPDRPLIGAGAVKGAELDVLPSPYINGILTGLEWKPGLMSSRGCVFQCSYCSGPGMFRGKVRCHSVDRVIRDLKIMAENIGERGEVPRVNFWDDNLCLDKSRTRKLFEAVIREGLKFNFHALVRTDLLDREILAVMKDAGVSNINFGLESAVPQILRNIGKMGGNSPDLHEETEYVESVRRVVKDCKELGITPTANVMFGLPGETYEDGLKTLKMIEELKLKSYHHSFLMAYVGTRILKDAERFGMDIGRGENVLPLKVKHPYDVTKIPILPHVFPMDHTRFFVQSFENALFEWWDINKPFFKILKPQVILEDLHDADDKLLAWLESILNYFSPVILKFDEIKPVKKEPDLIKERLESFLKAGLLSDSFPVIEKQRASGGGGKHYRLQISMPGYCPSNYYSIPFRSAAGNKCGSTAQNIFYYEISSRRDVKSFIKGMKSQPAIMENSIIDRMLQDGVLLASACRFMGRPCSALSVQKFHVRKNGEITTCGHGDKIGVVGDSMDDLENNVRKLAVEMEKRRGCSGCRAKDRCARCLFTSPFTEDEYCDFVREAGWLTRMLRFIMMCHDSKLTEVYFDHLKRVREMALPGGVK